MAAIGNHRSVERMIVAAGAGRALEGSVEFGRDLFLRDAEALEVARISGGGPEPHDVAGIDRQRRCERRIEKAAMYGGRRRSQLVDFFLCVRRSGSDNGCADA